MSVYVLKLYFLWDWFILFVLGVFCCGFVLLKVVKKGEVYFFYDIVFVFVEVNGDCVYWNVKKFDGLMKVFFVDKKYVGNLISMKVVGFEEREDIIYDYKYFEGWFFFFVY